MTDVPQRPFRPRRYTPAELFGEAGADIQAADAPATLRNISSGGIALRTRGSVRSGDTVPLTVMMGEETLLDTQARVAWAAPDAIGTEFGCAFEGDILDLKHAREAAFRHTVMERARVDRAAQFDLVPPEYVMLGSRMTHALYGLKDRLAALETSHGFDDPALEEAALEAVLAESQAQFQELWYAMNDIVTGIGRKDPRFAAIKWYSENVLRLPLADAPVWKRSYEKPLGYPGDFRIMLYAYDSDQPVTAPTRYDAVAHSFLADTLGACIRGRMHLTLDAIREDYHAHDPAEGRFEMLNIGCGAAREVKLLLEGEDTFDKPLDINLIEQDEEALQYAIEDATHAMARASGTTNANVSINPYHASFKDVMRAGRLTDSFGPQDVIYSLGLIDYFSLHTAKRMAEDLYAKLKPGGQLIFCNVKDAREGCYWPLEFLCDWTIQYRSEEEMMEMFSGLEGAEVRLDIESSQQIWVIFARKPG